MRVVMLLCLVGCALAAALPQNKYTTKYDNIDVDHILSSDRILNNYIKCMLDEGPCTAEGRELKKILPDALANGCNKCNAKQKAATDKVTRHLSSRRPRDWEKLTRKYDPRGNFKKIYKH